MMLIRIISYIVVIIIALAIYGLFSIKDKVASLHYQVSTVSKQLVEENNMLHILKAEQAYLTSPVRLRKLMLLYLQLDNIKVAQMVSDPLSRVATKYVIAVPQDLQYLTKTTTKWRYKTHNNNRYIKTVSSKKVE
ncbi:hypothetical protein [Candidatus Tisiphia endosymbiont of Nemotelus uliginosus]|uniref:cell division protein FtsL n=1 Tax=Candidatus Tisiphia endosymbiont of Nemotelus uliginosus TaxID=3077926 RepID=UPI0035C93E1E